MYKFDCFQDHYTLESNMYRKIVGKNLEWPKMAIPNFFLTIFSKKTCINSEWPIMAIANFPPKDWYKFGMVKNGHSKFFLTIFPKKMV